MSRTTLNRVGLALALVTVLSQSAWAAAPHHVRAHAPAQPAPAGLVAQAWNHLVSIFGKVGSAIDPNGASYAASTNTPATTVQRNGN
jgi:hypothetical protein